MSLIPFSEIRDVKNITTAEKQRIYDFLQGAVYCWCKRSEERRVGKECRSRWSPYH